MFNYNFLYFDGALIFILLINITTHEHVILKDNNIESKLVVQEIFILFLNTSVIFEYRNVR